MTLQAEGGSIRRLFQLQQSRRPHRKPSAPAEESRTHGRVAECRRREAATDGVGPSTIRCGRRSGRRLDEANPAVIAEAIGDMPRKYRCPPRWKGSIPAIRRLSSSVIRQIVTPIWSIAAPTATSVGSISRLRKKASLSRPWTYERERGHMALSPSGFLRGANMALSSSVRKLEVSLPMRLTDLIAPDAIVPIVARRDQKAGLAGIERTGGAHLRPAAARNLQRAFAARAAGLDRPGNGVALPHAKLKKCQRISVFSRGWKNPSTSTQSMASPSISC